MGRPAVFQIHPGCTVTLGAGVFIEAGARIVAKADIVLGDGVYVGPNCTLIAYAPLTIGSRTLIAENVSLHTEDHGPAGRRDDYSAAPITIGSDAWLGAGVVVTKGVSVGDRATVAANAAVVRDVPADALAAGVPAVVKRVLTEQL